MTEITSAPYLPRPPGIRARSLAQSLPCAPVTPGQYVPSRIWRSARADLALFDLAIDSKLRGCDSVALRVDDVAPNGNAIDLAWSTG